MERHNLTQGSAAWAAHRARYFNASDAAAMLGCSPYKTRAQLLAELHTGVAAPVDAATQRRFDDGHRFEALARPLAEDIIGEDLAPVVGTSGELSASFDGLTMMGDVAFEHKTLNDELRDVLPTARGRGAPDNLPKHYRVQMEQQLLVSGADRVLFMATKWTASGEIVEERHCWYTSDAALRAELIAGWKQFAQDLATYKPQAAQPVVVAAPVEQLPAVAVRLDGQLVVASNLDAFATAMRSFIDKIPARPSTDQEFADCEAACKQLKKAEQALEAAETTALASLEDVNKMRTAVATLRELARTTRLQREKLVEARKAELRTEQVLRGKQALADHVRGKDDLLGGRYMPEIPADFAGAIRGLKTMASIVDAVDTELARAKAAANEVADRVQANLKAIDAAGQPGLFADRAQLALKNPDDCAAVIAARLTQEQKRLEDERARIRAEEAARIEREQQEAERRRQEEQQRASAAATAAQPTAAAAAPPAVAPATPAANDTAPATVVPMRKAAPPTLRLGVISERLGFTVNADFLQRLGFAPAGKERSAVLYHDDQFDLMCEALVAHVRTVQAQQQRRAA